jgi:hypothetical protein
MGHHVAAVLHHRFRIPTHRDSKMLRGERMLAPPTGSQPLPGWAERATVSTLRTGYPHVQASSQDNGSHLLAEGSSEAAMCPCGSGSNPWLGAAPGPPHAPATRGSSGATTCHLISSTHLLAQSSSGAATCHLCSVGCKQINKYPLATRPL